MAEKFNIFRQDNVAKRLTTKAATTQSAKRKKKKKKNDTLV